MLNTRTSVGADRVRAPVPRAAVQVHARVLRQRERLHRVEVLGLGEVDVGRRDDHERVAAHRHQRLRVRVVTVEQLAAQPAVAHLDLVERVPDEVDPAVVAGEHEIGGRDAVAFERRDHAVGRERLARRRLGSQLDRARLSLIAVTPGYSAPDSANLTVTSA